MAQLAYVVAFLSTALRIAGYLFLRVIPSPLLRLALVTLYCLHLPALFMANDTTPREAPVRSIDKQRVEGEDDKKSPLPEQKTDVARTILLSLPSASRSLTLLNVAINTIVLLLAADFVIYPVLDSAKDVVFTRVGAVYPDSAKLVVRYPVENATESQLRILWRQAPSTSDSAWHAGPEVHLTAEHDWVNTVTLDGLWPSTSYEYILGDDDYSPLRYPPSPIQFHTFPDPRLPSGSHFRFVVSSCVTPNFPYAPFQGRRIKGFDLLADYLWASHSPAAVPASSTPSDADDDLSPQNPGSEAAQDLATEESKADPEFMLFLGDFIYADVPMYFGDDAEAYRRLYRRNYQSDSFRRIYERLPIIHTYDDHEIINNYVGEGNDSTPPFANAADAFRLYNADANFDPLEPEAHYYDFRYADVAFFVMDTRRYRSDINKVDVTSRSMLGDTQLSALYEWLGKVNTTATFKFIVSSVPFTSLWQHDAKRDSWAAYPHEKMALLNAMHSVPNVIVLSGDRHEFAAIKFNAEGVAHSVLEISTSPLSMFYIPFVRTLRMVSETMVKTVKEIAGEGGKVSKVEKELPQEEVLRYIAEGNYKWSAFEVDTRDLEHPIVHLEVMIDGVPVYKLDIMGKPVELHPTTALGAIVPSGVKGVLEKIGLKPPSWFS